MLQAVFAQQHEKPKGSQVSQAVPVDGDGPELQGNRVDGGMNQHGDYCALRLAPWGLGLAALAMTGLDLCRASVVRNNYRISFYLTILL